MIQLFNGDCLEVMKDISSNSVDLIICDLPFSQIVCDWDVKVNLEAFWKEVKRIRKSDHTPCLHFCTTKFGYELIQSNEEEFRYDLVWNKHRGVSFLSANKMPMRSHELIYVFSKKGAYYNRVDISGTPYVAKQKKESVRVYGKRNLVDTVNTGTRCVLSVIDEPNPGGRDKHPTEKPVSLYKFLIERYCPEGGVVLDPTFGSGNSGLAAKELGRKYIGIEKDKDFYEKAVKKLS